jgi:hypothetical protein
MKFNSISLFVLILFLKVKIIDKDMFKKFVIIYEEKLLNNSCSDYSSNSEDNQKANSKRAPEPDNSENNENFENEADHVIKKAKYI